MSVSNYTPKVVQSKEVSTNVVENSKDQSYLTNLLKNTTRGYTFMTFDAFRISLGKNNGWGKKVFFETLSVLNILCKTPKGSRVEHPDGVARVTTSSYTPCKEAVRRFPELFVYDFDNSIWGFDGTNLHLLDDGFLREMSDIADELREMYSEEDRIKAQLRRLKTKRESKTSGEV